MSDNHKLTFFRDFIDAVGETIAASDPAKREILSETMLNYLCDFPDDYYWATGPQAPTLLSGLIKEIDLAARRVTSPGKRNDSKGNIIQFPSRH